MEKSSKQNTSTRRTIYFKIVEKVQDPNVILDWKQYPTRWDKITEYRESLMRVEVDPVKDPSDAELIEAYIKQLKSKGRKIVDYERYERAAALK